MFQFHPGTIKSMQQILIMRMLKLFQFHPGTIKRVEGKGNLSYDVLFQFHPGTIKSYIPIHLIHSFFKVSIPPWYD